LASGRVLFSLGGTMVDVKQAHNTLRQVLRSLKLNADEHDALHQCLEVLYAAAMEQKEEDNG